MQCLDQTCKILKVIFSLPQLSMIGSTFFENRLPSGLVSKMAMAPLRVMWRTCPPASIWGTPKGFYLQGHSRLGICAWKESKWCNAFYTSKEFLALHYKAYPYYSP